MNCKPLPGRRAFLKLSGLAALGAGLAPVRHASAVIDRTDPTHVLHIRDAQIQVEPGRRIVTTAYDDQLPGPLLRAVVGQRVRVDVYNETAQDERIWWHGQQVDTETDVPAHSTGRVEFTPTRAGLYFYHSNVISAANLNTGMYSAQFGVLQVEPALPRWRPVPERLIVLKDCEPFIRRTRRGCEIGYRSLAINGHLPGTDGAVLIHVLNASATQSHELAIAGHSFEVLALDGNPLPAPTRVAALQLSPGERVAARVQLRRPGGWIVRDPGDAAWDYARFGTAGPLRNPDRTLDLVLTRHDAARSGFNRWSFNGKQYCASDSRPLFVFQHGLRYRLKIRNGSDEAIPLHLQNHLLEITRVAGRPTGGIYKDVVNVGAAESLEVDFVARHAAPALLYCTRRLHRDFGLMARIDYT